MGKYQLLDVDGQEITPAQLVEKYFSLPELCFIKADETLKKEETKITTPPSWNDNPTEFHNNRTEENCSRHIQSNEGSGNMDSIPKVNDYDSIIKLEQKTEVQEHTGVDDTPNSAEDMPQKTAPTTTATCPKTKGQVTEVYNPGGDTSQSLTQDAIDEERARRSHGLPMPEIVEDEMDVVSEEELESFQKPTVESFNPIISVEDFFSDDMPLDNHSIEESPCLPIINTKPGVTSTETVYYCKLHPELGSNFLTGIELHCIQKEPDIHKAQILRVLEGDESA